MEKADLYTQAASTELLFQKAVKSGQESGCVGLAPIDGGVVMRDEKNPDAPRLAFTKHELACFLNGVRNGEFDHLIA